MSPVTHIDYDHAFYLDYDDNNTSVLTETPKVGTCFYKGNWYREDEIFRSGPKGCLECFCSNAEVTCENKSCKNLKSQAFKAFLRSDADVSDNLDFSVKETFKEPKSAIKRDTSEVLDNNLKQTVDIFGSTSVKIRENKINSVGSKVSYVPVNFSDFGAQRQAFIIESSARAQTLSTTTDKIVELNPQPATFEENDQKVNGKVPSLDESKVAESYSDFPHSNDDKIINLNFQHSKKDQMKTFEDSLLETNPKESDNLLKLNQLEEREATEAVESATSKIEMSRRKVVAAEITSIEQVGINVESQKGRNLARILN